MRTSSIVLIFAIILINHLLISGLSAQNLEELGREDPIKISGGLSVTNILYGVSGIESRRDPHTFYIAGNMNFDLYGWSVPISVSYSNQKTSFTQPFNQYGLSPTYKWITTHLGWRSMNFSSYTLSGHSFLGGGVELTPGNWQVSMMCGRLNKAMEIDPSHPNARYMEATYERWGYGAKVGYRQGGDFVDLIFFRAKDNESSLVMADSFGISPQENLVFGINGGKRLIKSLMLTTEFASSALTRDTRALPNQEEKRTLFHSVGSLFTPLSTTEYHNAFKAGLNYSFSKYAVALGYERIDPGYETLGSYFFNNDLENITAGLTGQLLNDKLSLGINTGVQRNNLDQDKISTQRRLVSSINCNYSPVERWNFSGSYSNFTSNSRRAARFDEIVEGADSISFYFVQVTDNSDLSVAYMINGEASNSAITLSLNWQEANERQGRQVTGRRSDNYNANLGYSFRRKNGIGISTSINTNRSISEEYTTTAIGPSVSINKGLFKDQVKATWSNSYNRSVTNGESSGNVFTSRIGGNYTYEKKHNFNLSLVMMNRGAYGERSGFTEYTGTLTYSFNF